MFIANATIVRTYPVSVSFGMCRREKITFIQLGCLGTIDNLHYKTTKLGQQKVYNLNKVLLYRIDINEVDFQVSFYHFDDLSLGIDRKLKAASAGKEAFHAASQYAEVKIISHGT